MVDYEYLFAKTLRDKLWEHVYGSIYAAVRDDELYVKIQNNKSDFVFETTFDNFANRFINGWSTELAMVEVLAQYKKFVIYRHFKEIHKGEVLT